MNAQAKPVDFESDISIGIQSSPRPLVKRKSKKQLKPEKKIVSRFDLSFTALIHREDYPKHPLLNNWLPIRVPRQINQWSIGYDLGEKMANELIELHGENEEESFHAIQFAFNSPTWKVCGHGEESGFSAGIAALAIVGMRYLQRGASPYEKAKPAKHKPWTAKELIAKSLRAAKKQTGALFDLYVSRAEGEVSALFNVGLIDEETYTAAYNELNKLRDSHRKAPIAVMPRAKHEH